MGPNDTPEIFQDKAGEWRWRLIAGNGEIIATSGEGYVNETHARQMIKRLWPDARTVTRVEDVE